MQRALSRVQDLLIHEVMEEFLKTQCHSIFATKDTVNGTFQNPLFLSSASLLKRERLTAVRVMDGVPGTTRARYNTCPVPRGTAPTHNCMVVEKCLLTTNSK
jgi:hypothetical protein